MAWLAVDKDKEEYIYSSKPKRAEYGFWVKDMYLKKSIGDRVELPKGSIKKLLGRKLNWEDEPVEI